MNLRRLLLGPPLASREKSQHKLGVITGIAAIGLDSLSSAAYGPEAVLAVLGALSINGLPYLRPIMLVVIALIVVLTLSYRQTINAYPQGGGSYTVARENLGTNAGLAAAAALMLDYILNAAVAISAGVGALVSIIPALQPYTLTLCLVILALMAIVNLRGPTESGELFAWPTYTFISCFIVVIAIGVARTAFAGGHPDPLVAPPALPRVAGVVSLGLLMHAFAAGCTAMTGIEAVSNAVPSFAPPPVRTAKGVLTTTVAILLVLLAGVAYLAPVYHIAAMDQAQPGYQTVLAQLAGAAIGHGVFYYLSMTALLLILCLSANTSFLGFPALCRSVALDKYLPNAFTNLGSRLVYTVGIIVLTLLAAILLIVFGGITDRLIPLFAVGAFLAFTLSQAGMVVHWRRAAPGKTSRGARMLVNAVGALSTGVATIIIVTAKFTSGAWIPLLGLPLFISIFKLTKRHYLRVQRQIRRLEPLELSNLNQPLVLLPTDAWNKLTHKAVRFGLQISRDLTAIHLSSLEPDEDETVCDNRLRHAWAESVEQPALAAGLPAPRLHIIHSPYRQFLQPLLAFIQSVKDANPQRTIVVLVPEIVKRRWWLFLLHHVRAERLKSAVLELGDPNLVIVNVPWYLQPGPLTEPEPPLSEPHEPLPQPPPHPA